MSRQTGPKRQSRPMRALGFGILMAGGLGLVLLQSAPSIDRWFNPVRTSASDQLASGNGIGWLPRITGQTSRNEKIKALEAEVRDLERWRAAAITMAERMEAYETILNLQGEPPARGITARIVAESDGPFTHTLLANAGAVHGVEQGFVAVNEGGLVGRVIQSGARSSRILEVTDFNSRVPVMGEQSGVRAIMYGGRSGRGALEDLPEDDAFIAGERMLTSGEGGAYPRGVVAGYAVRQGAGWQIDFAMNRGRAGFVRLIPQRAIPKPENDEGEAVAVNSVPSREVGSGARRARQ